MKRVLILLAVVIVLAGVIAAAYAFRRRPAAAVANAAPPAALTVATVAVAPVAWPAEIHADGELAAWQEVVVGAEIGGLRIARLLVDVGDQVVAGQELATLADDTLQATLAQQQALVEEAEANLQQAVAEAARVGTLDGTGVYSEQQAATYAIAARTARARLAAANAGLAAIRVQLAQTHVRAADDGVVAARSASLGATVQAGAELFRLVRRNRVEWRAAVIAADLPRVAVGNAARITLPGGATVAGTVRAIDPALDAQTRTAVVRVDLSTAGASGGAAAGSARPGMFVGGALVVDGPAAVLTLPETAVIVRDGHSLAFAVITTADGGRSATRVAEARVTAGRRRDGLVEVAGLAAGTVVVASGGAFLADGDTVALASTPATAAAAQ